jgi:hypothetical protein
LVVAAVDGIEFYSSFDRCCDACMEREIEHEMNGELRTFSTITASSWSLWSALLAQSPWVFLFRRTAKARSPGASRQNRECVKESPIVRTVAGS